MISFRKPATFLLIKDKNKENRLTYSIESDKGFFSVFANEKLLKFGTIAEWFLTNEKEVVDNFLN
jgi:hypothetical protein